MTGEYSGGPVRIRTTAGADFSGRPGWTWFVPAEVRAEAGVERAFPLELRSAHTSLLARATGYVVLTEDRPRIAAGEPIEVVRLGSGGR
jgi:molybdopterin biosynthesis enzyme